jgi:hypothetical protein
VLPATTKRGKIIIKKQKMKTTTIGPAVFLPPFELF